MSVKILRRTHAPLMRPAPPYSSNLPGLFSGVASSLKSGLSSLLPAATLRARKSADPAGFSVGERIREFIFQNAPSAAQDLDMDKIMEFASKLKMPLVALVGIAAAASIIYLVYKLYTNRASIAATIDNMMADLKSVAPDLTRVPGWFDTIKREVVEAFSADNPASVVERLVKIKDAVIGHQQTIGDGKVGAGINYLLTPRGRRKGRRGAGMKVPL